MTQFRQSRARARATALSLTLATGLTLQAAPNPALVTRDFDHDGIEERVVAREDGSGRGEVQKWFASTGTWVAAPFDLPDSVRVADSTGGDAGLRFLDLNADGFEDLLYSGESGYAIYLWNQTIRADLGWTRGWTEKVREGRRTGAAMDPPPVLHARAEVVGGQLVIHPGTASGTTRRVDLRRLLAFDMPPPKSPAEALATFQTRPGFRIELVAAEPMVMDPVAFDWSADGRLWVVEMGDYPTGVDGKGKPGGVVKTLHDDNHDGRCDRAVTFLEGLLHPTSVMAWRKGVLVAMAPDLIYAEDTDGDGRADRREVLFSGFHAGNQQHLVNGFELGLDGWVYLANGDSGGTVRSRRTGQTLGIAGRDLRIQPDTGAMETVSGQTQYGLRRDDWGHWFGNNNPRWLWHVTIPEHYLRRNPRVAARRILHELANYDSSTRVYPTVAAVARPNQPWSLNHVTSACSPAPYRDTAFGPDHATSVFICEPVHNVIHREVVRSEGSGLASSRAPGEERCEFLASSDPWFRPTTVKTGPDGALYLADMYRFVIEHPEWIAPGMLARMDVRAGQDLGRIYRIVREDAPDRKIPDLSRLQGPDLPRAMDSPNGWQRDTVQRLILERRDPGVSPVLTSLLTVTHAPQVRIQALATLGLLDTLSETTLAAALRDPHPAVRREALRQTETRTTRMPSLFATVAERARDPEPSVRLQAAFTLGAWPASLAEPVLRDLLLADGNDETLRTAALTSLDPASKLFAEFREPKTAPRVPAAPAVELTPSSPDRAAVIARYAGLAAVQGDATRGQALFNELCARCHRLRGEGFEVGPDLGMVATKPVEWLLGAILDPAQAIQPRYQGWRAEARGEEPVEGILAAETANNIVLRQAGGIEQAILRTDLVVLEPIPGSFMPSGFESALDLQGMADLLRWLREP